MTNIREEIAKVIKAETDGGYLESWEEYAGQLTKEQQDDYFDGLAEIILNLKAANHTLQQLAAIQERVQAGQPLRLALRLRHQ